VFRGHVPNAAAEIAGFDLLVIPSHAEPLASVTGEAAAVGVPVVAAGVGGLTEGVGEGGVLVPPQDPRALASAISALLGDPARRRELSARALAGAFRFDPEPFAEEMDQLLQEVAR
jgi:glycosyltransferase involved in cell wall biosynthesis